MSRESTHPMKTITVANQKGGVGKTTLTCHLAFRAAEKGLRVLVVDTDEGDLSLVFPAAEADDGDYLKASHLFTGEPAVRQPRRVRDGLALIEADIAVLDVDDLPLDTVLQPRAALARFADQFDLCILDTPPNLQRRMLGAVIAADAVVSPLDISAFSFARMEKLQDTIANVQGAYNPKLEHLGYLASKVNSRSASEIDALPALREAFGDLIFDEVILNRSHVAGALAQGRPVWAGVRNGAHRAAGREMLQACDAILARLGL